jgi:hypothetical protein
MEKIKNFGWGTLGVVFMAVMVVASVFMIKGGAWVFANYYDLFQTINGWVWIIVLLLLVLSVIPSIRIHTGLGIYYGTHIWGAFFWLFCLFVTYELWGLFGVLVGLVFAGVGVFATALIAVLLEGEGMVALMIALNLAIIYGVRMLGYWIATKHREKEISITTDNSINTTL